MSWAWPRFSTVCWPKPRPACFGGLPLLRRIGNCTGSPIGAAAVFPTPTVSGPAAWPAGSGSWKSSSKSNPKPKLPELNRSIVWLQPWVLAECLHHRRLPPMYVCLTFRFCGYSPGVDRWQGRVCLRVTMWWWCGRVCVGGWAGGGGASECMCNMHLIQPPDQLLCVQKLCAIWALARATTEAFCLRALCIYGNRAQPQAQH